MCGVLVLAAASLTAQTPATSGATSIRADFLEVIKRPAVPLAPSSPALSVENGYAQERVSFLSERDERVPVTPAARERARQWFIRWLSPSMH